MVDVTISKHALGRILERANKWSEPALTIAWRAYTQGLSLHEMTTPLQSYINSKKSNDVVPDCTYKFFEKKLFIFKKKHLITVYKPPSYLTKEVEVAIKKSRENVRIVVKKEKVETMTRATRKNRALRLKDGQKLFDQFFRDPELNRQISDEEMRDLLTYTGYQSATLTIQQWVEQKKIDVERNNQTGQIDSYDGRTAFTLCNSYRNKKISREISNPTDTNNAITIVLDPRVRKLYVQMAQSEDITLSGLLSRYLNQIGQEKIAELDKKIQVEMESLRSHYIGEVSL